MVTRSSINGFLSVAIGGWALGKGMGTTTSLAFRINRFDRFYLSHILQNSYSSLPIVVQLQDFRGSSSRRDISDVSSRVAKSFPMVVGAGGLFSVEERKYIGEISLSYCHKDVDDILGRRSYMPIACCCQGNMGKETSEKGRHWRPFCFIVE
ncbi:hypothetical protein Tco_1221340 [Tanacetum coccineum]